MHGATGHPERGMRFRLMNPLGRSRDSCNLIGCPNRRREFFPTSDEREIGKGTSSLVPHQPQLGTRLQPLRYAPRKRSVIRKPHALQTTKGGHPCSYFELRVREDDCVNVGKKCHHVRVFDRSLAWVCAVISILKVDLDKSISMVAVKEPHALADGDQVVVENGLELAQSGDVKLLVPPFVPPELGDFWVKQNGPACAAPLQSQRQRAGVPASHRLYVPSLRPSGYSSCSGVSRIDLDAHSSFSLATRLSRCWPQRLKLAEFGRALMARLKVVPFPVVAAKKAKRGGLRRPASESKAVGRSARSTQSCARPRSGRPGILPALASGGRF